VQSPGRVRRAPGAGVWRMRPPTSGTSEQISGFQDATRTTVQTLVFDFDGTVAVTLDLECGEADLRLGSPAWLPLADLIERLAREP
jgi:hypothetical protein